MTTFEDISSVDAADEEPDPLSLELGRLCRIVEQLEQLHCEYFGSNPSVPNVFKIGRKALNSLTDTVEIIYRTADEVKLDIVAQFQKLHEDYISIEPTIEKDFLCPTDFAKLEVIEDELHNPGYKRFGLL